MLSSFVFGNRTDLNTAVDLWFSDQYSATAIYGDINTWDVSAITDFSQLFNGYQEFSKFIQINLIP